MNLLQARICHATIFAGLPLVAMLAGCGSTAMGTGAVSSVQRMSLGTSPSQRLLYIADLNGMVYVVPARVHVRNPQPIRTITAGITRPNGIWVDGAGTLYVVNITGGAGQPSVVAYKGGASKPFLQITNLDNPQTVAVDKTGTIFVNGAGKSEPDKVFVYAAGSTKLQRIIALPGRGYDLEPGGMAFDKNGNLLVAEFFPRTA